ncbi:MAG: hypothetical protein PHO76_12615 [Methylotenera sp.]|nr:hypothetical protein [Methylotenera sp.]MDD4926808.1 hypothetical protein [Methylotenera sp.]
MNTLSKPSDVYVQIAIAKLWLEMALDDNSLKCLSLTYYEIISMAHTILKGDSDDEVTSLRYKAAIALHEKFMEETNAVILD